MERRADWFVPMDEATFALWWVPASHIPSLDEGRQRLMLLRREDPTCHAFDLDSTFLSPVSVLTTVGHDLDIYRTANVLVKHYGEDAALEAAQSAREGMPRRAARVEARSGGRQGDPAPGAADICGGNRRNTAGSGGRDHRISFTKAERSSARQSAALPSISR